MAHAGLGSRRECEDLIRAGRVTVNGRQAKLGDKADPGKDRIIVDGRPLKLDAAGTIYIALHKPKGVISSLEDELGRGRKTVRDLINIPGHLYPVGRLDKQSTGLMLMTNDGELAHKLTHPRFGHEKSYLVTLEGSMPQDKLEQWRRGVHLDGRKTRPAKIKVLRRTKAMTYLQIVLREGRKRQIRRIANMLGHPVRQLVRQRIGPLELGRLKPGEWRYLTPAEVASLREQVERSKPRPSRRTRRKTRPTSKSK